MTFNFQKVFDAYAASNKRVWSFDRTKTLGASEAFQCIRRNFFTKHSYEADPDFAESYGATSRGQILEAHYVVPALRSQLPPGAEILYAGDDQVTLVKGRLSATPDGLITDVPADSLAVYGIADMEASCFAVEIKTFDSRLDLKEPKPVHAGQVQQQMGLIHETTNHRPEYAVIIYVNASWLDDIRVFVIKRDPAIYAACKTRADMVYDAANPGDLAPEGKIRGGSECDYCPFQRQCSMAQIGRMPVEKSNGTIAKADEENLRTLAVRDREIRAEIARLTKTKDSTSEELKEFLRKEGRRFAKTSDGYSVTYSVIAGRKSYDYERIVQDTGINLDDYASVGDPSERITVKAPKE
jgi:CRISPR/Cas system-associated exonuclease Cas4 (RecB family)